MKGSSTSCTPAPLSSSVGAPGLKNGLAADWENGSGVAGPVGRKKAESLESWREVAVTETENLED